MRPERQHNPISRVKPQFYCIGCGSVCDKKCGRYEFEHVCRECWQKVPFRTRSRFNQNCRLHKLFEKREAQGYKVDWMPTAIDFARTWSMIRDDVGAFPFPAGLRRFLKDVLHTTTIDVT